MKKLLLLPLIFALQSCTQDPEAAAHDVCNCMNDAADLLKNDEKIDTLLKVRECGEKQKSYKKAFNGNDLSTFNREYDACLSDFVKTELLKSLLK